jgi:class 3 adenylate cyclase
MIDDLVLSEEVGSYTTLVDGFYALLFSKREKYNIEFYKFTGDGFILFMEHDEAVDNLLKFCIETFFVGNHLINWFIEEHLTVTSLPRIGITAGVARGSIFEVNTANVRVTEYIGRPINFACRLQSSLISPDQANRLLMEPSIYRKIEKQIFKKACKRRERSFKNLSGGNSTKCYEFNPMIFASSDWRLFDDSLVDTAYNDPDFSLFMNEQLINLETRIREYIEKTE